MTAQPLSQRVARATGEGWGCFFHYDAFDIEEMVGKKMVTSSFSGAALGVSQARAPT
jgi:hypothetical protein